VRWRDHHGLEWWEGRELGVCSFRRVVRRSSEVVSHSSRGFGEGQDRGEGTWNVSTRGDSVSQSVWSHVRRGGGRVWDGESSSMVMGTWAEPVEGRDVSHPLTKGKSRGLAKARSMTEGRALPDKGYLVYTPGELSRAKPPNAAFSK